MKCVVCGKISFNPICSRCFFEIKITPTMRVIEGVSIYSFYNYSDVSILIKSKYYVFGSRILKILSAKASDYFFNSHLKSSLWKETNLYGIGIDDCVRSYYSHTAVILKEFCRYGFKPDYGKLQAKNNLQYAGKSLQYRRQNPKNLFFKSFQEFFHHR